MAEAFAELPAFHEIDWKRQEEQDARDMQNLLNAEQNGEPLNIFGDPGADAGEKDDNAQDYEDISDDDLPEEEEATGPSISDLPGLTDDNGTSNDTDDLFGEGRGSSPFELDDHDDEIHVEADSMETSQDQNENLFEINFPGWSQRYAAASNQDLSIPAPAESEEDLLKQSWPKFQKGIILNWSELLPTKKAHYIPKLPLKAPKPLNPTKVSLDLAPDQEKLFRTAGPGTTDKNKRILEAEAKGLVPIIEDSADEQENDEDMLDWGIPPESEKLGGVTWTDLQIICDDWDSKINPEVIPVREEIIDDEPLDEWEQEILGHSSKRKKVQHEEEDYMSAPQFAVPSFDDIELSLAVAARQVILDLNDPHLLIDYQQANTSLKRSRIGGNSKAGKAALSKGLNQRFNISNDEAYDALKENHQSKVRATLGNLTVEHSLPALKLQWPYYKVQLNLQEARAYHRPAMQFKTTSHRPIIFARPGLRKRKALKNMSTQEIFNSAKDLTLADHYSTAALLEYSEEHPIVLSNFGMGNRIVNYYRKKNHDDAERPTAEDKVGDVTVLLPEDKSPFSNFGMVDPGETVKTIHNGMYRAPIFKHDPKNTDFLVIRSHTGAEGFTWQIRNIDHIYTVGQQFPSVEIPGPHSRKVTNAAKNRMKMIAYRQIKHSAKQQLKIGDITKHIKGSSDMQNRQKLKEFILYDKVEKVWRMKPGEPIPDESAIRSMVKPEEVCLIDSMQVGSRFLEDSGYAAQDEDDDNDDGEGQSIEQDLAPWKTSKAFLEASADKAMLQLHGEGDPSGCGLALSMIKTSMKGGYIGAIQGPSATSAAAIAAERKANGGHTYNVKKQQVLYNDAIRHIWEKQKANLSDQTEHLENDLEREQADEDERLGVAPTPHSMATPAGFDDSASQMSRFSDNRQGKFMRITRKFRDKSTGELISRTEEITNPRVWREYQKRRLAAEAEKKR